MEIRTEAFELILDNIETKLLENKIEFWFTGSYNSRNRLFGDMDKSIAVLDVAKQIRTGAMSIRMTRYQAKMIASVIFDIDRRQDTKGNVYLPNDSNLRPLYDELVKLTK